MLQETRQVTEMAAEYGIAPRLLHRWRREGVEHLLDPFADAAVVAKTHLLSLSRVSLYYHPRPPHQDTAARYQRIDELYTATSFYGSWRLTVVLRQEGWSVNQKLRVYRPCGPWTTSRSHSAHRIYPYLLRGVTAAYPNRVWGSGITCIRVRGGWLYLVAVLDWFSRYVVSWGLSEHLIRPCVWAAANWALE